VFVDEPGVPIEHRKLDGRIGHRELDGKTIAPVGQRLDVGRQIFEMDARQIAIGHVPAGEHDGGGAARANDDSPTAIGRQRLERDVVDDALVLATLH